MQVGILLIAVFLVKEITPSPLEYKFNLKPVLIPKQNLTFHLKHKNTSPTEYFIIHFSVIDLKKNESAANNNSILVPSSGVNDIDKVEFEMFHDISFHLYALRTQVSRFEIDKPSSSEAIEDYFIPLYPDLRKSLILITLDKEESNYAQGDWVYFSVTILDKFKTSNNTSKKASISIWKVQPEYFLIRRWEHVEFQANRPFVTGEFEIPRTIYDDLSTKETFEIFVTIDERSEDDDSILEGLTVPQSTLEQTLLGGSNSPGTLFYSQSTREIRVRSFSSNSSNIYLSSRVLKPSVSLDNRTFIVEVNATNKFGYPISNGSCIFVLLGDTLNCFELVKVKEHFVEGHISLVLNTSFPDESDYSGTICSPPSSTEIVLDCEDEVTGGRGIARHKVTIFVSQFDIKYTLIGGDILLLRVMHTDTHPLEEVYFEGELRIVYFFKHGSILEVNETLGKQGFVEHKLRVRLESRNLDRLSVMFGDTNLDVEILSPDQLQNMTEQEEVQPRFWSYLEENSPQAVSSRARISIPVISENIMVKNVSLLFWSRLGNLPSVTLTVNSDTKNGFRYLKFLTFQIPISEERDVLDITMYVKLETVKTFWVNLHPVKPLEIENDKKQQLEFKPPQGHKSVRMFGVAIGNSKVVKEALGSLQEISVSFCGVSNLEPTDVSDGATRACAREIFSENMSEIFLDLAPLGLPEEVLGLQKEFKASLHHRKQLLEWKHGWVWDSMASNEDALSIELEVPFGTTERQLLYPIIIDEFSRLEVGRPFMFDPKAPFAAQATSKKNFVSSRTTTLTILNNSNSTLRQMRLLREDPNCTHVCQKSINKSKHVKNVTLNIVVPPFSHKRIELNKSEYNGLTNLLIIGSYNGSSSGTSVKFPNYPRRNKIIDTIPVYINNVNTSVSNTSVVFPHSLLENNSNATSFGVKLELMQDKLYKLCTQFLSKIQFNGEFNHVEYMNYLAMTIEFSRSIGSLTPRLQKLLQSRVKNLYYTSIPTLKNFIRNWISSEGYHNDPLTPPNILATFFPLNDTFVQNYTRGLEIIVNILFTSYKDLFRSCSNEYMPYEPSTFIRVQYLLAFHRLLQKPQNRTLRTTKIVNLLSDMDKLPCLIDNPFIWWFPETPMKFSTKFSNSSDPLEHLAGFIAYEASQIVLEVKDSCNLVDVFSTTYLLDELGRPEAISFFARAKMLMSLSSVNEITPNFATKGNCEVLETKMSILETSLALMIFMKRGDLNTAHQFAFSSAQLLTGYTWYQNLFPMQALTMFADKVFQANLLRNNISVELDGNLREGIILKTNGIGVQTAYITLLST